MRHGYMKIYMVYGWSMIFINLDKLVYGATSMGDAVRDLCAGNLQDTMVFSLGHLCSCILAILMITTAWLNAGLVNTHGCALMT